MPDFGVALAWMILAPIALVFNVLSIIFIQHYRPLFHSTDVALMSLLITSAMTSYFVIPIPAVLELGGWDWNHDSCNFYAWLSSTVRFSHLLGLLVLNVYWVNSLRAKSRQGHIFMSSFCMKISVCISWFVSVIIGLVPVTGGTELFGFYSSSSCHFLPSSISVGFGLLIMIVSLSCVLMSIVSSADTLLIFRSMKKVALAKYNAGRFPMPAAGVSGVARSTGSNIHAKYSELSVATELCKLALYLTVVSSCLNVIPFVVMQFMLLFDNAHRGTFEDLTLWLQLVESLILPHLMWMLSGRYRHAVVYAWKVYVMKDASVKEEDASSCTLQSYKVRAMEQHQNHHGKATINGVKKIQTNGTTVTSTTNHPTTSSGIRRPSGNKICPIEQPVNGLVGGRMPSSSSGSYSVTDLDDGMTVLSSVPHQTPAANGNGVGSFDSQTHYHPPPLSNGEVGQAGTSPSDVYSRPVSKIKPLRKHVNSPAQGPRVAFAEFSETSSGHGSPHVASSAMSSPAKSLLGTPKRDIDVKRTASACSRREWKEKMRKKHLPAIFVNNSVDDDKEEKIYSNIDEDAVGSPNTDNESPESYEMKEVVESDSDKVQRDTEIIATNHKQQSFCEDNFYVSSEFHYNFLSESLPRKPSLRTQSTVDSDEVCDMYESDDIGTILDASSISDSTSNKIVRMETNAIVENNTNQAINQGIDLKDTDTTYTDSFVSVDTVTILSENQGSDGDIKKPDSKLLVKSSLDEFEENERNVLLNDETDLETEMDRPVSRLKLIDLEGNNGLEIKIDDHGSVHDKEIKTVDLQTVSQDYDQLETVSGSELLQLKQQAVKTVRTAHEITFDSSSDDGGVDNGAFEGDGDDSRDAENGEIMRVNEPQISASQPYPDKRESVDDSDNSQSGVLPDDMVERYVTGKEDSEESGSSQGNDQDREMNLNVLHDSNPFGSVGDGNSLQSLENKKYAENETSLKRGDFKTNPFLRESFEVLVHSPEYQQKIKSQDNPFFISVKPLALPRQRTLESSSGDNSTTSSDHSVSAAKVNNEVVNRVVTSKPPLPSRPMARTKSKPESTSDNRPITARPPVPVRKPPHLRKQNSQESMSTEGEESLTRPRTSSEDELEKIFITKENSVDSDINGGMQEDPFFPGEDPPSSTVTSNDDCNSPVFMSPVKEPKLNLSQTLSNDRQSTNSDCSIVIEPYGQRRPPWLDESLESDLQSDDRSFSISVPMASQYSPGFSLNARTDNSVEEYDFDSVKIRGVTETKLDIGNKSNSGSSNFFSSSGSDSSDNKITPVSGEEKPTFQFYQFDDDIERGFEDALSVDYLTHSNVYSGFGLCFESIKEEPEDSLSESASSFDGLGDSNSSALFKTQAIISRPSSRASVSSSPNLEVNSLDGSINGFSDTNSIGNRLSVFPATDQGNFNFGVMDNVNYESFASMENESFVTSERTSGDGREEVVVHSNGNGSTSHPFPALDRTASQNDGVKTAADPWSLDEADGKSSKTSKMESRSSPWLEVKSVDLDLSFESDFSQQNEGSLMGSGGIASSNNDTTKNGFEGNFEDFNGKHSDTNGEEAISSTVKTTKDKPMTQTIHYEPVYF